MATLDELGARLVADGVHTGIGDDLFLGHMPDTPDECSSLRETPGRPPVGGFGIPGIKYEHPSAMYIARGVKDDEKTPRAKAETAYTKLAEINAEALSGTSYLLVEPLQSPSTVLGPDEKGRPRVSFNVAISKELS